MTATIEPTTMQEVIDYATEGEGNLPVLTFWRLEDTDRVHVRIDSENDHGTEIRTATVEISDWRYMDSGLRDGREYEFGEVPFRVLHAVADVSDEFREFLVRELQP